MHSKEDFKEMIQKESFYVLSRTMVQLKKNVKPK